MADRRGVFQRRHLSPVGEFGLQLLLYSEGQRRGQDLSDQIRLALLATGNVRANYLFPETFSQLTDSDGWIIDDGSKEADKAISKAKRNSDVTYDYSDVDWKTPSDNPDELDEFLRLQESITANMNIEVVDGEL